MPPWWPTRYMGSERSRWAARIVEGLARAVHCAHQQGIVHLDRKPANALLTEGGDPEGLRLRLGPAPGWPRVVAEGRLHFRDAPLHGPGASRRGCGRHRPRHRRVRPGAVLCELLAGLPPFRIRRGPGKWPSPRDRLMARRAEHRAGAFPKRGKEKTLLCPDSLRGRSGIYHSEGRGEFAIPVRKSEEISSPPCPF